ncbi:myb-related transcription factor, partner of profilin-like [Pleurodeles waltl]|uniref:myb-related transcription factor, partner of profilin-like n=1 Tax=Pleurodeles waltl TaxID=8319 RepID=UPI0037096826
MADTPRKRKLKFAEKELEVLTDECCQHHDELFGKAALNVPDSAKKRIWQEIQEKVNSLGVSHRSVDELKKRWYDLRSRTEERVAERLREMRGTGGGPSTIPPPTPLEERVEETLEPESVTGFGELDTSEPGPSTGSGRSK